MLFDEEGDGDWDLVLGDLSFQKLNKLVNGGTPDDALMISQDVNFPSYDVSFEQNSYPAPFSIDVDMDGQRDMLVSPNSITNMHAQKPRNRFNPRTSYENVVPDTRANNFQWLIVRSHRANTKTNNNDYMEGGEYRDHYKGDEYRNDYFKDDFYLEQMYDGWCISR